MGIEGYVNNIDNNIDAIENVSKILDLALNNKCDENNIINIVEGCTNKVAVLNFIAVSAISCEIYDIVIPLLKRAYEIDNKNTEINYNMAYVLHLFKQDKLALDYLFNIDSDDDKVSKLKIEILNDENSKENYKSSNSECNSSKYYIDQSCDVRNIQRMKISDGVVVQQNCWLDIAYDNPDHKILIEIGEGSNIGRRCEISAANRIVIGKNVLVAPNVFIADCSHEYKDINIPIMHQGISGINNEVHIGDGTWIGTNSVICGNISIGKNCIIGSNTIVRSNIPDYSIAVGNPSKIVKMFDKRTNTWVKVDNEEQIDKILEYRALEALKLPIENLQTIQVEVSSACNLKCPQCPNNLKTHKVGILKKSMWDEKIRPILKYVKDIHLVGIGEPLLCKDFFDYVDECVKRGIVVNTTSNLQLVNDEIAEKIVTSGITNLSFSCDGATKETYEKIRVNGTFEKLIDNLQLINKYKKKYDSKTPNLILNFGALRWNIEELPDIVEFAKELKVDSIIAYHDIIYFEKLKDLSLYNYQELSDQMFCKAEQLAKKYNIQYFCPGTFKNPIKYNECRGQVYCMYPFAHLWIYSDGRVGPCCMDFPKRIIVGDLNKESMAEVWNNENMLRLRQSMIGKEVRKECIHCGRHGKLDVTNKNFLFKYEEEEYGF